jgi:hypothetical protein
VSRGREEIRKEKGDDASAGQHGSAVRHLKSKIEERQRLEDRQRRADEIPQQEEKMSRISYLRLLIEFL